MRQLTEIERTLGGVLGLKGLHFHGIGRGIYCCRTLKRFRLIEWFEGDTEIERRLYRYPNNPRVKHRHISPVSEKYEFWNERWFRKRYESHKGMIRDCHPSDYMYGKHTQTTLDGV